MAVWLAILSSAVVCASPNTVANELSAFAPAPRRAEVELVRYAAESGSVESVLLYELDGLSGQRLTGVTRFEDGTTLWEDARFDHSGALLKAAVTRACPSGASDHTVLDAQEGVVAMRDSAGARRWSVPTDYPWFWSPRGCANGPVTTPVSALVALRGGTSVHAAHATDATQGGARRVLDTWAFVSHSITSDQVVVEEDARSSWVILGDDAVLMRDGLPQRWFAHDLDVDVVRR